MAVDKLVDSAQLDSDLNDIADAILAKSGGSGPIAFPVGFVSEIGSIPSGGGTDWLHYAKFLYRTFETAPAAALFPSNVEIDIPYVYYAYNVFVGAMRTDNEPLEITVHFNADSPVANNLANMFNSSKATKITVDGNLSGVTTYQSFIAYNTVITHLYCELDFTSVTSANAANIGVGTIPSLIYLRFKQGTLSVSCSLSPFSGLDDDSLVSIANGLNGSATGQTLTLHATPKARCASLMGTVSGGVFAKDAGGSVSLSDFISTIKGWTLA